MHHRTTTYARRSRRQRKRAYIRVKNAIREQRPYLGSADFCTKHYLATGAGAQWANFWFLSQYARLPYNAMLFTARFDYFEKLEADALEAADRRAPMPGPVRLDDASLQRWQETRIDGLTLF